MNKVTLIGRLTRDTELRVTKTGKNVVTFTLAVPRAYKKDAEVNADFIFCVAWQGTAETIDKYVKKGHRVAVSGRLETSEHEVDGKKYKNCFVTVEQFEFLEPKAKSEEGKMGEGAGEDVVPDTSDIPF